MLKVAILNEGIYMKQLADRTIPTLTTMGLAALFVPLFFYIHKFAPGQIPLPDDQAVWAQFGDFFGGVTNPSIVFLALIGLIVTIRMQ